MSINLLKKILFSSIILFLFISCVAEEELDDNGDLIVTIEYKGDKNLKELNFLIYDYKKGIESKEIYSYKKDTNFPVMIAALDIKYGKYKALVYATENRGDKFNKDKDPFFIVDKIDLDKKELSMKYTIIADDECNPNNCLNGSKCIKLSKTDYRCECLEKFSGKNCEIEENRDLSCLGNSCSTGCSCDANYCIPRNSSHAGAEKENICTIKNCRGNETICPEGYKCIDSHRIGVSFCTKLKNSDNIGEIEFKINYNGIKKIKKIGIGFYVQDGPYMIRNIPPFAASSQNDGYITFPYSFKVTPTSKNFKHIWLFGDINGNLFPNSEDPKYIGDINITSDSQTIEVEIK